MCVCLLRWSPVYTGSEINKVFHEKPNLRSKTQTSLAQTSQQKTSIRRNSKLSKTKCWNGFGGRCLGDRSQSVWILSGFTCTAAKRRVKRNPLWHTYGPRRRGTGTNTQIRIQKLIGLELIMTLYKGVQYIYIYMCICHDGLNSQLWVKDFMSFHSTQIRAQHTEISPGSLSEVKWLASKRCPKYLSQYFPKFLCKHP